MGWRRKAYFDQWPGNGPFSHLPPWLRPGQVYGGRGYGRGRTDPRACARYPWLPRWWWADQAYPNQLPMPATENELAALEDSKKELGEEQASIEQEISDLELQIKELKIKLEQKKEQPAR